MSHNDGADVDLSIFSSLPKGFVCPIEKYAIKFCIICLCIRTVFNNDVMSDISFAVGNRKRYMRANAVWYFVYYLHMPTLLCI